MKYQLALAAAIVTVAASCVAAYNPATPFAPHTTTWSAKTSRQTIANSDEIVFKAPGLSEDQYDCAKTYKPQSIYMHERRCVSSASFRVSIDKDEVKIATLNFIHLHHDFDDKGWGVPPFRLQLWDASGSNELAHTRTWVHASQGHGEVHWPSKYRQVQSLPEEFEIRIVFDSQVVSTYVYEFANGIPQEMFDTKVSYDLVPQHNTVGTHFMMKVGEPNDDQTHRVSVWVQRKAPVPPFFLSVIHDEMIPRENEPDNDLAHLYVEPRLYSSSAFGLDMDIEKHHFDGLKKGRVRVVVWFMETHRDNVATTTVPNLREVLRSLPNSNNRRITLNTDVQGVAVRLVYHKETKFTGLHILQPNDPIEAVEISLERHFNDGSVQLLLRESDAIIPHYRHDSPVQYGWYDAIPTDESAMTTAQGLDVLDGKVVFTVRFNASSHAHDDQGETKERLASRLLKRWARLMGASTERMNLDHVFSSNGQVGVHAPHVIGYVKKGEVVAAIPFNALLPYSKLENSSWAALIRSKAHQHEKHVQDNGLHAEADRFLIFSAVILGHLFEETTNFRVMFETFRHPGPRLPIAYTAEELALFKFEPTIEYEVSRMKSLWDVEFAVLTEMAKEGSLPTTFTRAEFDIVRAQLETRLINISGSLTLTPLADLLPHDDNPSVVLKFDDEENELELVANRDLGSDALGRRLTMDLGKNEKTLVEFLLQHGNVPDGARHAVHYILPDRSVRQLEATKESVEEIHATLKDQNGDAGGSAAVQFCRDISKRHAIVSEKRPPPTKGDHVSASVAEAAHKLMKLQEPILKAHKDACEKNKY